MYSVLCALFSVLCFQDDTIRSLEQRMAANPTEALALLRQAALSPEEQPREWKRLATLACDLQERRLAQLGEDQVADLANTYAKDLADRPAAERVQKNWLRMRLEALGAGEGQTRLHYARLTLRWLGDQETAKRLCREVFQATDPSAAAQMLKKENPTATEVRQLLGPPQDRARQILYRRHLEQWVYHTPPLRIEFDCASGQEPQILTVQTLSSKKP